jgi:DNA-binding transcriptional LysR family regulator
MSFTKAAEELYISQQSVSTHIKRLEEEYHVQLFERRPALKLTAAGQTFLLFAKEIVSADQMLLDQLAAFNNEYFGTITIGLPVNRTYACAREFVPWFTERFPNMNISLYEKHSATLLEAIQRNEIDLAMVFRDSAAVLDPLVFCSKSLGDEPLYAVISDSLMKKYFPDDFEQRKQTFRDSMPLEDIAHLPLFIRPSSSRMHLRIVEYLRGKGCHPNVLVQTASTSAMMPLCVRGYGVIFCTPMLLRMFQEDYKAYMDELNLFPVKHFERAQHALLVWTKNKYISTPIRESMDMIQDIFRKTARV